MPFTPRFSSLRVLVLTCSGESLELEVRAQESVRGLQHTIAYHWKLPPICVMLTLGASALTDAMVKLEELQTDTSIPLIVTAIFSMEKLHQQLLSGRPKEREMAVDDLLQVADRDYEGTVQMLSECFRDPVFKVRAAATEALGKIARPGDACAIAALASRLADSNSEVKQAALEAIAPLLEWGEDGAAADVLKVCFEQGAPSWMKAAAADVLAETAPRGNQHVLQLLINSLENASTQVCRSLITALCKTALHGDEAVVRVLCQHAHDNDWEVRAGAITALGNLVSDGDAMVISLARQLVQDSEPKVRLAAVATLSRLVDQEFQGNNSSTLCSQDCKQTV
mmetsp:Transcript_121189/g.220393  ORF Transcript_121189/g.220393 Transcript_121189/m.220393 type:complete len:339 (-) Transcript_121189:73-1089(-)